MDIGCALLAIYIGNHKHFAPKLFTMTSDRGKLILSNRNNIENDTIPKYYQNPYHPESNKTGTISFCIAQNKLCEDILSTKIMEHLSSSFESDWLYYPQQAWGTYRFRQSICDILNSHFNPCETILPDNIVIGTGATAVISMVCLTIMDPGDYMLCMTPHYFRNIHYISDEAGVKWYNVPMIERQHFEVSGSHGADQVEKYYKKAVSEGYIVKGLFLINPDNPTGKLYSKSELMAIFKLCKKYGLHVIVDEVYALTVYSGAEFSSVLSIEDLPDPERTHFIWGLSKDFCLNGFRCGVIYTKDKDVLDALKWIARYHIVPVPVQSILSNVLSDREWIENVFLPTNKLLVQNAYKEATNVLQKIGIPFYKGSAGFFIWADFSELLPEKSFDEEYKLLLEFAENGVLMFPGYRFYTSTPGYFRIIFTVASDHLTEGLARIKQVCQRRRNNKKTLLTEI